MRYTIHNPTTARRVIYDGIEGSQKRIQIAPLETKHDIELADHIAAGFSDGNDGDKSDLWVTPLGFPNPDEAFAASLPPNDHAYQTEYRTAMKPSEDPVLMPPPPPAMPDGYQRYQAPSLEVPKRKRGRPPKQAKET